VSLGEDKAIPVWPFGIFRIVTHDIVIQSHDELHCRKGASWMTRFGFGQSLQDQLTSVVRDFFQMFNRVVTLQLFRLPSLPVKPRVFLLLKLTSHGDLNDLTQNLLCLVKILNDISGADHYGSFPLTTN
jgi:hypothetical protein